MKREFTAIIERDSEGFFVASVPVLRGCHTQAKTLDDLNVRLKEAILLCIETEDELIEDSDFIGLQRVVVNV
ncbi:type II toxin-antitoxin system HicB family antitoxin [Desulfobacterales bacterium HSG17]|nr:type II toxin-antitoxin system HicB family antitoxin [Desulfobacterales bacterium HSG17]